MDQIVSRRLLDSPYRRFTRDAWAQLRADTLLTLTIDDLRKLQSTHDPIAIDGKVPYIIGIAGSVAAGKSTTARVLQALLTRWPNTPKVQLITTDGFLL